MFWKRWCRSFIRLIGGFILSKSGVIYTHADIDVYIFNKNISSNCIIIKTMEAASRSSRRTAAADNQFEDCRGTRVWSTVSWGVLGPRLPSTGLGPSGHTRVGVTRPACGPRITGTPDPPHTNHHIPASNHKTSAPTASFNRSNSALSV